MDNSRESNTYYTLLTEQAKNMYTVIFRCKTRSVFSFCASQLAKILQKREEHAENNMANSNTGATSGSTLT